MKKKIILQLILFSFILLTIFFLYFKYFNEDTKKTQISKLSKKKDVTASIADDQQNLITDINYSSTNGLGSNYEITAQYGTIDNKNSSIILMQNVKAIITDLKQNKIVITSLSAKYNSGNRETNFINNIVLTFADNTIKSQNLDLFFEKNLVYISNKIVYKNSNITLEADKLEMEMLSKDIKIYMYDKNQKIQISGIY
tara:strand:+ start:922 stop:1515 length:594 start_codon:yes stop_codon:yes gene_type:complete